MLRQVILRGPLRGRLRMTERESEASATRIRRHSLTAIARPRLAKSLSDQHFRRLHLGEDVFFVLALCSHRQV